jgi:hypothetical protein
MSGRRIELSATQVIASMLAAVTGAVAASYTGIAGTMIGVAVMSVASTAGGAFYQYYLGRSQERLRSAAVVIGPVIAPLANHNGTAGHRRRAGEHAQATASQARADAGSAARQGTATGQLSGWPWSPDSPVTDEFPAVSDGASGGWGKPPAETGGQADSPGTRHEAASRADSPGTRHEAASQATSPGTGQATTGRSNGRRRWLAVAGTAIGVFVFALGSITAVEMAAGKPLDALIWGRHATGTTIGDATGAQHGKPAPGPTPSDVTPSPSHRPTTTPPPTPTPTSTSPTPSPSATRSPSPAPSPAQSTGAPVPASPGPTGSLGQ